MQVKAEFFDSGWVGLSMDISLVEIDQLIQKLEMLKGGVIGHFHIRADDFSSGRGIADIELSLQSGNKDDLQNMTIE